MGRKRIDLAGQKFGRWAVLSEAGRDNRSGVLWNCRCECGNEKIVLGNNLRTGKTISCGCYSIEKKTTHGMHGTRFYNIWQAMKNRCQNKSNARYQEYGGRGVKVCDRWQTFENFRDDIYDSYLKHVVEYREKDTTIDRIDVNGDYEPDNVRWATYQVQNRNQRIRSTNSSGSTGVYWNKDKKKWHAQLRINGKQIHLGYFTNKSQAIEARKSAEQEYFTYKSSIA